MTFKFKYLYFLFFYFYYIYNADRCNLIKNYKQCIYYRDLRLNFFYLIKATAALGGLYWLANSIHKKIIKGEDLKFTHPYTTWLNKYGANFLQIHKNETYQSCRWANNIIIPTLYGLSIISFLSKRNEIIYEKDYYEKDYIDKILLQNNTIKTDDFLKLIKNNNSPENFIKKNFEWLVEGERPGVIKQKLYNAIG